MWERLEVDAMVSLKEVIDIVRGTKERSIAPDQTAEMAVATKEAQTTQVRVSQLGPVGVTLEVTPTGR